MIEDRRREYKHFLSLARSSSISCDRLSRARRYSTYAYSSIVFQMTFRRHIAPGRDEWGSFGEIYLTVKVAFYLNLPKSKMMYSKRLRAVGAN